MDQRVQSMMFMMLMMMMMMMNFTKQSLAVFIASHIHKPSCSFLSLGTSLKITV